MRAACGFSMEKFAALMILLSFSLELLLCRFCKTTLQFCDYTVPKIPIYNAFKVYHWGISQPECELRMELFDWSVVLYCEESVLCGLGLDQSRDWRPFLSSAVEPVGEMCRVIVNVEEISCTQFKDTLFHIGIMREVFWNCHGKGGQYCQLYLVRDCSDVFGGFQCGQCLPGSTTDLHDDKSCIMAYEWSNWDENSLFTVSNSETQLIKNISRNCVNLLTGDVTTSNNCVGQASKVAILYNKLSALTWPESLLRCIEVGANIFDGTTATLDLSKEICLHSDAGHFWTSIGSAANDHRWINIITGDEVNKDSILWDDGEPNGKDHRSTQAVIFCENYKFHDAYTWATWTVVCTQNMMHS